MAQVAARENLLVRPGLDLGVDERVARRVVQDLLLAVVVVVGQHGAIEERVPDAAWLEVLVGTCEVVAARDGDGAEPLLVCACAVCTVSREGVLGLVDGVAGDLLEGVGEVFVEGGGVVVVDLDEFGDVEGGVGGDGVCYVGAEW